MDVQQKLIAFHLRRLKDPSPTVRLETIGQLHLIGGEESLDALREVFENDRDRSVRKAAQDAGLAIYNRLKEQR
jgi:HEAT repeat protein